jgi:hypothetical protein
MALTTTYITTIIGNLQTLHGRFANELCNFLKRRPGNMPTHDKLISVNSTVGYIIDILYDYDCYNISTLNDLYNNLTESEIMELVNWSYRSMNKYMNNIFIPTNANVYL